MEINELLHGFRLREVRALPELSATLYRMEYEKNGADLVWLRRMDDNKTFAITFKTIPQDSTGVFHILEHSVLCGSEKYPVKEPFVELLKGSLQTFLNAFTFPDKTMYPVSSRNSRDFLNLIDVYMDAVLHPLSVDDPHAFRQEGWHYELEDGALSCNGVVYNEMKGAYASPDTVLQAELGKLLFPDNCYGFESGGDPEHITDLSYEDYLRNHRRFYHPSNARIFLDGDLDLDAVLEKLDGFLRDYDRLEVDAEIPMQKPVRPPEATAYYEISPEEDPENKVLLAGGWVYGDYSEQEKILACGVLTEVLCDSNESPLKKALLEADLAEDVEFQSLDGIQQQYVLLVVRNTSAEKKAAVWETVRQVLRQQVETGVDRERLGAVLNRLEFATREKDYGSMPRGLVYAMSAMESWLYGGDPAQNLCYEAVFRSLREKLETDYYERFIEEFLLNNPHQATLTLLPSKTLGAEKQEKENRRLAAIRAGWSEAETERVAAEFAELRRRQAEEDTPEALASLPRLALEELSDEVPTTPQTVETLDGVTVLHQPVATGGILYLDLMFSLADVPTEALSRYAFLSTLLGQVATEHYDVGQLRSQIEGNLGRLMFSVRATAPQGAADRATPYFTVTAALLESRKAEAVRLLREVLTASKLTDRQYIYNLLRQTRLEGEQAVTMSGNAYARARVAAAHSVLGAVSERLSGLRYLRWVQESDGTYAERGAEFCQSLAEIPTALFSKRRVTVSLTGEMDRDWLGQVLAVLSDAPMGADAPRQADPRRNEGFSIPAEISFTAKGAHLTEAGAAYSAECALAAQILSYGYLWNTVRVQGGAYGTGLSLQLTGHGAFSSFRDPGGDKSLQVYDGAGEALRKLCDSGEALDNYIISTVGAMEPLLTPRMEGQRAVAQYFTGRTDAQRRQLRWELLHMTPGRLREFGAVLDRLTEEATVCVIGGKEILEACGDAIDTAEPIMKG